MSRGAENGTIFLFTRSIGRMYFIENDEKPRERWVIRRLIASSDSKRRKNASQVNFCDFGVHIGFRLGAELLRVLHDPGE
jgi:hypothetical protein